MRFSSDILRRITRRMDSRIRVEILPLSAPCLYTVTGWGVMSVSAAWHFCVAAHWYQVPLLQAGTIVIWSQMFQSHAKPNKQTKTKRRHCYASRVYGGEITRYSVAWYNKIKHFVLNLYTHIWSSWLKCVVDMHYTPKKLRPNIPVKIKACIKWQPIVLICKQTLTITSGPDLPQSAIYCKFLIYLFLIKQKNVFYYLYYINFCIHVAE